MKINYDLTTDDYVELQKIFFRTSKGYKKSLYSIGIIMLIIFGVSTLIGISGMKDFSLSSVILNIIIPSTVFLFIILFVFLFGEKINAYYLRMMFKVGDNSAYLGMNEIELNKKHLIEKAPGTESKVLWEKIVEYNEDEKYLFIRISNAQGLVIPKFKAKSSTGLDKALAFIRTKLKNKQTDAKSNSVIITKEDYKATNPKEKKRSCLSIIKKILMWLSGFTLFLFTLIMLISMTQPNNPNDLLVNIILIIVFILAITYVWWEIIDSLRSK